LSEVANFIHAMLTSAQGKKARRIALLSVFRGFFFFFYEGCGESGNPNGTNWDSGQDHP
jgi:hypothetical protein